MRVLLIDDQGKVMGAQRGFDKTGKRPRELKKAMKKAGTYNPPIIHGFDLNFLMKDEALKIESNPRPKTWIEALLDSTNERPYLFKSE